MGGGKLVEVSVIFDCVFVKVSTRSFIHSLPRTQSLFMWPHAMSSQAKTGEGIEDLGVGSAAGGGDGAARE